MANNKTYKPEYVCWHEEEFQADTYVQRGMNWLQRHFYRALCIASHYCSTRPYLPDDDNELWLLADAESPEQWQANRAVVVRKFQSVTRDGVRLLGHKRVLKDWQRLLELVEKKRRGGRGRAKQMQSNPAAAGEHAQATPQLTEPETENKMETERSGSGSVRNKEPKSSVTPHIERSVSGNQAQDEASPRAPREETFSVPPRPPSGILRGETIPESSAPAPCQKCGGSTTCPHYEDALILSQCVSVLPIVRFWNKIVDEIFEKQPYKLDIDDAMLPVDGEQAYKVQAVLLSNCVKQYGAEDVILTLQWAYNVSDYWWKKSKGHIKTWADFSKLYEKVREQRESYFDKVKARHGNDAMGNNEFKVFFVAEKVAAL